MSEPRDNSAPRRPASVRSHRAAASLALLLGAAAALWFMQHPAARAPHPEAMACADCHLAGAAVTAENAHLLVASQERLCARCHDGAVDLSHPSGITPAHAPPADLPLDWKGDVTCSTCHEVHAAAPGRLRTQRRGADFCHSCHEAAFFEAMRDGGQSIVRSGHMSAAAPAAVAAMAVATPVVATRAAVATPAVATAAAVLDEYSAQCLVCHAERATYGNVRFTGGVARHSGRAVNHPVGKDYARWLNYGGYRPVGALPAAIRLPGGRVSCVSCHEGYSRDHGQLVMANDRSQLCFSCHDL